MKIIRSSLALVAVALVATACHDNGSDSSAVPTAKLESTSLFAPATSSQVPIPFDLFFADQTSPTGLSLDATLNIPDPSGVNPLIAAVNLIDGFSTVESIITELSGARIDVARANASGVLLISATAGLLRSGTDYEVITQALDANRERLIIRPLLPLNPATTHFVILTGDMRTVDGGLVKRSRQFDVTANPDPVGSANNPADEFSASEQATLELIRSRLIRPIFDNVIDTNAGIEASRVVQAWSFTTTSVGESLRFLAANPVVNPNNFPEGGIIVVPRMDGNNGQLSTGEIDPSLPDTADVFVGAIDLPYYLSTPSTGSPSDDYWKSNGVAANTNSALPDGAGGNIPCSFIAPSESTTKCYPEPERRSIEAVRVLVTVPNENSGQQMPANGWPVVIFLHGITADRTNAFAVAPALAAAGLVTVAIDIPLHGLPANHDFYSGQERTFDQGASGDNFINLANLAVSRDNNRQAISDMINLSATLRAGDIPVFGDPSVMSINLDNNNIHYIGHSLGGIIGTTLMGVVPGNEIGAATLAMPGGGILRLLDGSAAFGPTISQGLGAFGINEGSDNYETFIRLGQAITDTSDPINHAVAANANHAIHMIEVTGGSNGGNNPPDVVVPNFVVRNVAANGPCDATAAFLPFLDTACFGGPLSGTNPLVALMGLNSTTISPPYAANSAPADSVVRFTAGHHSSILTPGTQNTPGVDAAESAATYCEMVRQTAGFLGGAAAGQSAPSIPIGPEACP